MRKADLTDSLNMVCFWSLWLETHFYKFGISSRDDTFFSCLFSLSLFLHFFTSAWDTLASGSPLVSAICYCTFSYSPANAQISPSFLFTHTFTASSHLVLCLPKLHTFISPAGSLFDLTYIFWVDLLLIWLSVYHLFFWWYDAPESISFS